MKVKEMIAELSKLDGELEVRVVVFDQNLIEVTGVSEHDFCLSDTFYPDEYVIADREDYGIDEIDENKVKAFAIINY